MCSLSGHPGGKLFAAKYWTESKEHNPLRGTTPFKNAVDVYQAPQGAPYMNQLRQVIQERVMILDYFPGEELCKVLSVPLKKSSVIAITQQILDALMDMFERGVFAFDTSATNILVSFRGKEPEINFVDVGAYLPIDRIMAHNRPYAREAFTLYNLDVVRQLMALRGKTDKTGKNFVINGKPYAFLPPLTLYMILSERVSLLSALLTKLSYVVKGKDHEYPEYIVKERLDTFGETKEHPITPPTS